MEKKQPKKKTVQQKIRQYRTIQWSTFGAEWVSLFTPFIVMAGVNYEEWFQSEGGWKIGLGGSLALALIGIATFLTTKKKETDLKLTNGWITIVVGWFAVAFVFVLLQSIMQQIATIMLWGGLGMLGCAGLDITSTTYKNKADAYKKAVAEVKTDNIKQEVAEELGIKLDTKSDEILNERPERK